MKVLDYLDWRGDVPYEISPINEVDEYLFQNVGKPNLSAILGEDEEKYLFKLVLEFYKAGLDKEKDATSSKLINVNLKRMSESKRYGGTVVSSFVRRVEKESTKQFSAVTIIPKGGPTYVIFRGTDDSIVGWEEDFMFSVRSMVPSQVEANEYLSKIAERYPGPLKVIGHSKGGHLAIYAAATAPKEIQERIVEIISFDGPGFLENFFDLEGFIKIEDRIKTYVSTKSMIGLMLEPAGKRIIVETEYSGLKAHDCLRWEVTKDSFLRGEKLSNFSLSFEKSLRETLDGLDEIEREIVVKELFTILYQTGSDTITDISKKSFIKKLNLAKDLTKNQRVRSFYMSIIENMLKEGIKIKRK